MTAVVVDWTVSNVGGNCSRNMKKRKKSLQILSLILICCTLCSCQTDYDFSEQNPTPEKPPQQLLEEQPIDDTHDAFLVDTGGRLGTLLVTATLALENKDEFGSPDITFSVWNPAEMEQPVQTFSQESMMGVSLEFHYVVDANFDGFQDFGYLFYLGNQPSYCHYWLWDEENGQFKYCAPLSEISQAVFDPERQVVTGWARSSGAGDGVTTFHRWEDGELVCVRQVESFSPWKEPSIVRVQDRIDGELQQVYYEKFPWLGEEPEGQEAWRQAQHKWCDLDYHGEFK